MRGQSWIFWVNVIACLLNAAEWKWHGGWVPIFFCVMGLFCAVVEFKPKVPETST